MGASASSLHPNKLEELSTENVAEYIRSIPYISAYEALVIKNQIDGACLAALKVDDLKVMLIEYGVNIVAHRIKLVSSFTKIKSYFDKKIKIIKVINLEVGKCATASDYLRYHCRDAIKDALTKEIILTRSMADECILNDDGKYTKDFEYVMKAAAEERRMEGPDRVVRDEGHMGMHLSDFMDHPRAREAHLNEAEVAALRLYTGPFHTIWNTALRTYESDPQSLHSWSTCIAVLCSAIFKLSLKSSKSVLYRGVNESRVKLLEAFTNPRDPSGLTGAVDLGFMSTSRALPIALEFAKTERDLSKCSIFEIAGDATARGADVRWVSQYPNGMLH